MKEPLQAAIANWTQVLDNLYQANAITTMSNFISVLEALLAQVKPNSTWHPYYDMPSVARCLMTTHQNPVGAACVLSMFLYVYGGRDLATDHPGKFGLCFVEMVSIYHQALRQIEQPPHLDLLKEAKEVSDQLCTRIQTVNQKSKEEPIWKELNTELYITKLKPVIYNKV